MRVSKIERHTLDWVKLFASQSSDKEIISKIYKAVLEILKNNSKVVIRK